MYLALLLLDCHLFLPSWIALILSCSIVTSDPKGFNREFTLIDLTCDKKNCFIHMTNVITLSTHTSLASVELLASIFCFSDIENTLPCPNVRHTPVWLLQSGCTANDASMFQVRDPLSSTLITSDRWIVSSR